MVPRIDSSTECGYFAWNSHCTSDYIFQEEVQNTVNREVIAQHFITPYNFKIEKQDMYCISYASFRLFNVDYFMNFHNYINLSFNLETHNLRNISSREIDSICNYTSNSIPWLTSNSFLLTTLFFSRKLEAKDEEQR